MAGTEKELILLGLFLIVAVNEDSAVVSGAILSYKHIFPAWQPFAACFLGIWMSDFAVYAVSRFGGERLLGSRWMRRLISPEKVQRASILFGKYGGFATLFSRFVLFINCFFSASTCFDTSLSSSLATCAALAALCTAL